MYPARELRLLAAHKAALQLDIALGRERCAEEAARLVKPLEWLDRAAAFWKKLSPFAQIAAIPLGILIKRAAFPRLRKLGALMRWGPVVFNVVRGFRTGAGRPEATEV
jgi:hypothetical protein